MAKGAAKDRQRLSRAERQKKALQLRTGGMTLQQIADRLGYSNVSVVHRDIKKAIEKVKIPAAESYFKFELLKLDAQQAAIWGKVLAGDIKAGHLALKIAERRARLLGLDRQPGVNVEQTNVVVSYHQHAHLSNKPLEEMSDEELQRQYVARLEAIKDQES